MAASDFHIYFDGAEADEAQLDRISEVRIDQAIGMATEAELSMDIGADDNGLWPDIEEDFAQPESRVRVEARTGTGAYTPLIDGPIVGQRFELSAEPNQSKLRLIVQDDSVLLNRHEEVQLFESMAPHEIAQQLFQDHGLTAQVDSTPSASTGLARFIVQRGTAMHLLRELARRHGMFVYVKPGETPGQSVGLFVRADLSPSDLPELLLMGADRNVNAFQAQFDALRPTAARASSLRISDQSVLTSESSLSSLSDQGDVAAHGMVTAGTTFLARTREETADLDAATDAAVNHSSWAYTASAEMVSDMYAGVLSPYQVISVAGAGGYLSGHYLISRVIHTLNNEQYKQQLTLRRNARSDGTSGGSLPGGVF
jgi:phage protein D